MNQNTQQIFNVCQQKIGAFLSPDDDVIASNNQTQTDPCCQPNFLPLGCPSCYLSCWDCM